MRLTDVVRASLSELANDYLNWLMRHECAPWSVKSEEYKSVSNIPLDCPTCKDDVQHQSSIHILDATNCLTPCINKRMLRGWFSSAC